MAKNVPWTREVEDEFRKRVRLTPTEEAVFNLHMEGRWTQCQMSVILGMSTSTINRTLRDVKDKYKLAMCESELLPPFMHNKSEIAEWQRNKAECTNDLSRSNISALIDEWVLDERHRAILKRRFIDNVKFERLAEEFDMSVRQIKNIVYESEEKLHRHM